ncbi:MAG TPA: TIGR03619 family F420-dependent LLM class oxidoreductase [Solirubrobacterales bacterium]
MRFGLNLLNFGPDAGPRSIARWGELAEDAGFSFLTISDHVAITEDVFAEYQTPFYDPLITLAYLAAATERVRLGTSVLVLPYRHPLLIARSAANIDQLSGGRLFLGVGVGWAREEFEALDVGFAGRGRRSDEHLEVMRRCWAEEKVSHQGEFSSFPAVATGPPPAQEGGIPIWIGGESEVAIRRAVERGDVWHPLRPLAGWLEDEGLPALARIAADSGREAPVVVPRILLDIASAPVAEELRPLGRGSAEQIRADLEGLAALGIEEVLLDTYDEAIAGAADRQDDHLRLIERFVSEVADPREGAAA